MTIKVMKQWENKAMNVDPLRGTHVTRMNNKEAAIVVWAGRFLK